MTIRENIIKLRGIYDITQADLAEIAGVSRGAVSQWEGGFSEPRMGSIERIASHFGLRKSNIIEEGGMDFIDPITKKPKTNIPDKAIPQSIPTKRAYLPLLGRVHAGDVQEPDVIDAQIPVPYEVWERHQNGYLLEVEGNCMSKVYPEGCHILVDPRKPPMNGSIAVVRLNDDDYVMRRMYKGANTLILSPESWEEGYTDIVITQDDEVTVELVGTVVWFQPKEEME